MTTQDLATLIAAVPPREWFVREIARAGISAEERALLAPLMLEAVEAEEARGR